MQKKGLKFFLVAVSFLLLARGDLFAGENSSCIGFFCESSQPEDVVMPMNRLRGLELNPLVGVFNQLRDKSKAYLEFYENLYAIRVASNPTTVFKEEYLSDIGYLRWAHATFERMRDTIDLLRMGRDPGISITLVDPVGMRFIDPDTQSAGLYRKGDMYVEMRRQEDFNEFLKNPLKNDDYKDRLLTIVHELTHESYDVTRSNLRTTTPQDELQFYQHYFSMDTPLNEALATQQEQMVETLLGFPSDNYNPMVRGDIREQIAFVTGNLYEDFYGRIFDAIDSNPEYTTPIPKNSYIRVRFRGSPRAQAWGYRSWEMLPFFIPPAKSFVP